MVNRDSEVRRTPALEVALEVLYYDGGIRYVCPGRSAERPEWAPPAEYVGLRNQFVLAASEAAVEFARFLFRDRRVTWIGIFYRSVDLKYGDRQNHAGAGVWLLEADVVDAANLLHGLRQLAKAVAAGEIDAVTVSAPEFSARFLPRHVRARVPLPAGLSGIPYAAPPILTDVIYSADGATEEQCWRAAAAQVLRLSFAANSEASPRAFILVAPGRASQTGEGSPAITISADFERDLLGAIPAAFDRLMSENATLKKAQEGARTGLLSYESQLGAARSELVQAQQRVAQLEQQTAADTQGKMLSRILAQVDSLTSDFKELRRLIRAAEKPLAGSSERSHSPRTLESARSLEGFTTMGLQETPRKPSAPLVPGRAVAGALVVVVVLIGALLYFQGVIPGQTHEREIGGTKAAREEAVADREFNSAVAAHVIKAPEVALPETKPATVAPGVDPSWKAPAVPPLQHGAPSASHAPIQGPPSGK